jgi:hypothetical protein
LKLTRRGKIGLATGTIVALSGFGVGALALTGHAPAPIQRAFDSATHTDHSPPPTCPLTGRPAPGGKIPHRPALAVKVENSVEARPQSGLDRADIVYEEPVEGGITRFIAIYQCSTAARIGPVRSGRMEDPDLLVQFGRPLMGYAGGANTVVKAIDRSGVTDVNYLVAPAAYTRDTGRPAPHNLYTTTAALWKAGQNASKGRRGAPHPVFTYSTDVPGKSRRVGEVHLAFSSSSDVYWRWNARDQAWLRWHGSVAHELTDGSQVAATNVVVMQVKVGTSDIVDAAGNPSPKVTVTGKGKAYVFRDGRMIAGRWQRANLKDVTTFVSRSGDEISLAPGTTWIELLPNTIHVQAKKTASG